jgi:hypothetical protein
MGRTPLPRYALSIAGVPRRALIGALAIAAVLVSCASPPIAGAIVAAVAPLPASDYGVRPACGPPAPGDAGCLALQLVPETGAARAHTHPLGMTREAPIETSASPAEGGFGLRPQDLRSAYFPNEQPEASAATPQTIALVDAYDDPHAEADLAKFDQEFGLPVCTEANGCFRKVNQLGAKTPLPSSSGAEANGWAVEISTDIEAAHSICQKNCRIVLVEAESPAFTALETAEATAGRPVADGGIGATEISDSWGGSEQGVTIAEDDASAFNQPDLVITAAAGDDGYLDWDAEKASERGFADYPASSPHVVAVGGTHLTLSGAGDVWESEAVWNGYGATGGGCSTVFAAPPWQQSVASWAQMGCGTGATAKRAVADVSADGDPYTGMAMYDSTGECEDEEGVKGPWCTIGGTSLASPIVAAMFALAGGAHGVAYPAQTLYENEVAALGSRHDVTTGSNGKCSKAFQPDGLSGCTVTEEAASSNCSAELICLAGVGYDGPSGVGSPDGIDALLPGGGEEGKRQAEEKQKAEEKQREEEAKRKQEKEEEEQRDAGSGGSGSGSGGSGSGGSGSGGGGSGSGSSSGGSGSGTSGDATGTGATSGATAGSTTNAAGDGASSAGATGTSSAASALIPVLSELALTHSAITAIDSARPQATRLAFVFTLTRPARVRVTLAKQVRVRGRTRWQTLPDTITIAAAQGRDGGRLSAHVALAPGRYRLTLTPAHGVARTLVFSIG